jgi:hypothetical protein
MCDNLQVDNVVPQLSSIHKSRFAICENGLECFMTRSGRDGVFGAERTKRTT